jgi:drug/metabolite transporter (DMT)-like permease
MTVPEMMPHQRPVRFLVISVAVMSMLLWGMSFIWTTIALRSYNPITIIFIRLVLSSGLLFLFMALTGNFEKIQKRDRKLWLASALFNPFFYFLGENFGLKLSTPTIAAIIIATIPVFTPVVAWITLKEKLPWVNYAGMAISFTGIAVTLISPDLSLKASFGGSALLFAAVVSAVTYSVLLKKLVRSYRPLTIIAYQNLIGAVFFLPLFLVFDLGKFLAVKPGPEVVAAILQLAVFASSLAYIFYTMTVKWVGISRANVYSNLIPVFTAIFSFIFIHEIFTLTKLAGMAIVIGGVFISQSGKQKS